MLVTMILCHGRHAFAQDNLRAYLERLCPAKIPEVFLPGIVSGKHHEHSSPTFSPDGKTVY
jgi:hypothetical protein